MSFITTLSASATVVPVADVSPSITVSSAVVAASPSKISSSASPIFALPIMNPVAATVELNVAAPAADISSVNAVIAEPPSFPWKIISSSDAPVLRIRSPVSFTIYEFVPP